MVQVIVAGFASLERLLFLRRAPLLEYGEHDRSVY